MHHRDLFEDDHDVLPLADGASVLRGFALERSAALLQDVEQVVAAAPWRHMTTPGGFTMQVAMTNCGAAGWTSDRRGYRYQATDPLTGRTWPAMPTSFTTIARDAAAAAGYAGFAPDAGLINRYTPGNKLSLHQDRDERDTAQPIVSVSLGLPAVFMFGGVSRSDRVRRLTLQHGDVVVWGGASRLAFHGVAPLADGRHDAVGRQRINLTFRRAL